VVELLSIFFNSFIHLSIKKHFISLAGCDGLFLEEVLAKSGSSVVLRYTLWSQHSARVTVGYVHCITDCFLSVMGVSHLRCLRDNVKDGHMNHQ
jgi:hypothetical protein